MICVGDVGITEDAVLGTLTKSFNYEGCSLEIHICDPHRDDSFFFQQIPFDGVAAPSLQLCIEIVKF